MKTTLRMLAVATASGVVIALSLSGIARGITDTVFRYPTAKNGYLSIPPSAFLPAGRRASAAGSSSCLRTSPGCDNNTGAR